MPTTITGNPTGVASPSLQPDPDTVPVSAAPQDIVDGVNAVTVDQPVQAVSNEIAYLKRPTAGIPASPGALDAKYVQPIRAPRNVRGLRRDFDDHRGFNRMARITSWQEDWEDVGFVLRTAGGSRAAWAKGWTTSITTGSGTPQILTQLGTPYPPGPGSNFYFGTTLIMDTGNVTSTACLLCVERNGGIWVTDDSDIVFQFDGQIGAPGGAIELVVGLAVDPALATAGFASTSPMGAAVYTGPSAATHSQLYSCDGISSPVFTSLGASGDASTRFRLEYQGANASDDGNARILIYGDGDLTKPLVNKAVSFVNGTFATKSIYLRPFFRIRSGGGSSNARFGVTDFTAARVPGDIAY